MNGFAYTWRTLTSFRNTNISSVYQTQDDSRLRQENTLSKCNEIYIPDIGQWLWRKWNYFAMSSLHKSEALADAWALDAAYLFIIWDHWYGFIPIWDEAPEMG